MSHSNCQHAASGCNYPEGECVGLCRSYAPGTTLIERHQPESFIVTESNSKITRYQGLRAHGWIRTSEVPRVFNVEFA